MPRLAITINSPGALSWIARAGGQIVDAQSNEFFPVFEEFYGTHGALRQARRAFKCGRLEHRTKKVSGRKFAMALVKIFLKLPDHGSRYV